MEPQVPKGARAPPLLRLYLLGRFEVVREDAPIPAQAWRRRRPADLLKLVALAPGRTLTREQAIDALWPDKDPASGANNLHRALYDLRQVLGGRWVDIEKGQIRLRPDVWVDVDVFEEAVREGGPARLAEAVALYRGDLAPENVEADWLAARRTLLRSRFLEAAYPLARAAADAGDAGAALPIVRRLLDHDPAAEEAHQLAMRLLAESGRRAEALRQYDTCEAALRATGHAPSEETRTLRESIQVGAVGPAQARPSLGGWRRAARRLLGTTEPAPIRGRGALLLLLESLVEKGGGTVVLLGERGVGRTRLAVEGARLAHARGAAVLAGVAGASGPGAPYGLFADVFREEARVNPGAPEPFAGGPPGGGGEVARLALFDAVARALAAHAEGRLLYLLLDDLDEADESSLNLLHFLVRRAREQRLVIVGTCREDAIHAGTPIQMALAHLDAGQLARGVRVPRLGLAATREQIADLAGTTVPDPLVAQIYRATDGSPLLVEEAVRAYRESGQQVPADPGAALRARVARLGARAEAFLAAAAVAGRRFDFEVIRPVTGLTAHEALDTLGACLDANLLDEDGAGYHFHHDLVREAVYAGLSPERRRALHAALADALEAAAVHDPPFEALARHRRAAGQDDRALRLLVAAGHRAAARTGLGEALQSFDEALELLERTPGADGPQRFELLDASGRVQLELGETSGAARSFGEAARLSGAAGFRPAPDARARAHRLAALALAAAGHLDAASAEIAEGLLAAAAEPTGEDAPLLHLRAQLLWHAGRYTDAHAAATACAEAAARAGDADLVARGGDLAALALAMRGEPLARPADTTGAAELRRQDTAPEHPLDVHLVLWERDLLGDLVCADLARAAALVVERARMRDARDAGATGRFGEGVFALAAGQLEAAELALRAALDGFRAVGSALGEALASERLAALLTMTGRIEAAQALLGDAVVVAERAALRRHALARLHATEARNRVAAGFPAAAEDAIREASETAVRHGECTVCDAAFRPEAIRVALARGRVGEAEAEADALDEIARRRGGRGLLAIARLARARVLTARGATDEALVALAQARAAFLAGGQRTEAARTVRLEARLRGAVPEGLAALDALIRVDADA